MAAEVGDPAPPFELRDQARNIVLLDDLKGRSALVVFIPFPFTDVCHGELCTIRDNLPRLSDLDANVAVITCDTLFSNRRWSEENGFAFPVLSDYWPHGAVTQAYGAFDERIGAARRYTYVLDPAAVVRATVKSEELSIPREFEQYLQALQEL